MSDTIIPDEIQSEAPSVGIVYLTLADYGPMTRRELVDETGLDSDHLDDRQFDPLREHGYLESWWINGGCRKYNVDRKHSRGKERVYPSQRMKTPMAGDS